MVRMSEPDDFDNIFGAKPVPKAPVSAPGQHTPRSSADEVLDVVEGLSGPPKLTCDACKSNNVMIRGNGVSGQQHVRCRDCGHKAPWATRVHLVKDLNHRRSQPGPYRRETPLAKPDRNSPRYRARGKPMIRNEDDE